MEDSPKDPVSLLPDHSLWVVDHLARFDHPDAVPALLSALRMNLATMTVAAEALARIGYARAAEPLFHLLTTNPWKAPPAATALTRLLGQAAEALPEALLRQLEDLRDQKGKRYEGYDTKDHGDMSVGVVVDEKWSDTVVNCAELRALARKELVRRARAG